ncbi:hypothetical protein DSL72_000957 [Monilinia vaccinii-corymbosi]|uniref:Uncharacterized protein n=1 Tax=Monilinia vaccinii-corymbosi TaxID=61207 RepID=A0A8A3P2W5_9HELO|nr:hypothetical protein DSL72_000957 [Monilinia vaccinii-corymbosi]
MKRTINTTLLAFKDVIDRGVKVQAIDLLQNWDSCPNGIGMDKEDLRAHFGEQVDFDKVGDGWNNKSSGMWASENQEWKIPALKWKLGGLQSATDRIEVVIVSHGSTLDSLTGVHQTWGNGRIRSYLIDDCGQLISRLDENTLKEYRSHGTDNHMILASDCDSSDNLEHSELAAKPNLEVSKYFGPTSSVQTNCPNKTITEGISMNNTDGTVETAKQTQSSFIALVKLFRVETPATKFEWVVSKKVEARVTDTLEIISTVCQDRNTSLMIWLMYDCSLPRQLVMKKQVWLKVMIANPMGEKDQILGEDNGTAGWEVVVAVKL